LKEFRNNQTTHGKLLHPTVRRWCKWYILQADTCVYVVVNIYYELVLQHTLASYASNWSKIYMQVLRCVKSCVAECWKTGISCVLQLHWVSVTFLHQKILTAKK